MRKITENNINNINKIIADKNKQFIYLTTTGRVSGNKHTIELWFAYGEGKIFLSHEGEYTDWMKNIQKNPDVEFKIGGNREIGSQYNYKLPYDILSNLERFSGNLRIITNSQELEEGKYALYEKYYGKNSKEVIDDWFSLSTILVIIPD